MRPCRNSAFICSIGNRAGSHAYSSSIRNTKGRDAPMMNDVRGHISPVETTGKTEKIVAAMVVALGFGAVGAFAYFGGNSPPKQIAAVQEQVPVPAPQIDAAANVPPPSTGELQPTPDLPVIAPPPKATAPTEKAAALTKAPAKAPAEAKPAPSTRVARVQVPDPTPAPAPPSVAAEAAVVAAPAEIAPAPAAPQEAPVVESAPAEQAPAAEAAEPPAPAAPQ